MNNYDCSVANKLTKNIIPANDLLKIINSKYVLCLYNMDIIKLREIIKDRKTRMLLILTKYL